MKVSIKKGKTARIEMLPLIDIVFLLLVFFIYAMLSMAVHKGIPVELPSSSTADTVKDTLLAVSIDRNGSVYVDKEKTSLEDLKTVLQNADEVRRKKGALLFADKSVSYERLFKVMDQIRKAGIVNISMQAEAEPSQ